MITNQILNQLSKMGPNRAFLNSKSTVTGVVTMSTSPLPPVTTLVAAPQSELESVLALLLEPSPSLKQHLVPEVYQVLSSHSSTTSSYGDVMGLCERTVQGWPVDRKADFLSGHPRIGEQHGLSALSAREQASKSTPPEVLQRLEVRAWHAHNAIRSTQP